MTDVLMPQMGESIAEGTITKWLKGVGDAVGRDEPLLEISTDKVDAEIPSPAEGVLTEIRCQAGETVEVNAVIAIISAEGETAAPSARAAAVAAPTSPTAAASPAPAASAATPPAPQPVDDKPRAAMSVDELRRTRSSPVVRRIAAEHGVDIRAIPGTGISGRVTKADILAYIETRSQTRPSTRPALSRSTAAPTPAFHPSEPVEIVAMTPIRKKTAEHMVFSKQTSAHVTTVFEVDMTDVDRLRRAHKSSYQERSGVKLTFMPFIVKAAVDALKEFPILNCSVDGDSIVYKKEINVGIAVALDWGLIVPVIRRADERNVLGLARAVGDLAERARTKQLKVDEIQGGTFTITNPGVFGGLFGTPIINQPQVAILGVGTIEKRPVVREDAIAIRTMTYLALSFDHRVVDGADADRFMARLKQGLQEFDSGQL